jgi:ribose 5-phosphate isomerase B
VVITSKVLQKKNSTVTTIDDVQIQEIVQRVLKQVMGLSQAVVAPSVQAPVVQSVKESGTQVGFRQLVAIGADHGGVSLKELLIPDLVGMGFEVKDVGTYSKVAVDYPDYAHEVAKMVSSGKAWRGIMIDGAGIGSCIVANKVPGVRAGMAYDYSSAVNSREHNDTNVLTLGAGLIGVNLARQIVKTWLSTEFGGDRHLRRIEKISDVEKKYLK